MKAIESAIAKDEETRRAQAEQGKLQQQLDSLTARERQVFDLVVKGLLNKQIASELGAAEPTIKVHRARVMQKLQVQSVAELVQLSIKCGVNGTTA